MPGEAPPLIITFDEQGSVCSIHDLLRGSKLMDKSWVVQCESSISDPLSRLVILEMMVCDCNN